MIPVPTGVRIWITTGHTDMRKGMQGFRMHDEHIIDQYRKVQIGTSVYAAPQIVDPRRLVRARLLRGF